MNVIAEEQPFPLTARHLPAPAPFGCRLLAVEVLWNQSTDASPTHESDSEPDECTVSTYALPARSLLVDSGAKIRLEGWALDARGQAADDVYLEVNPLWATVPPRRFSTSCGWQKPPFEDPIPGGVDGSYFTVSIDAGALSAGAYDLAILVVSADRCSYSRAHLATVTVN